MRRSLLAWLALALLVALDAAWPWPTTTRAEPASVTLAVTLIIAGLGALARLFGGGVNGDTRRALGRLGDAVKDLAGQVIELFKDIGFVLQKIASALRQFWRDIIRPILVNLDRWIRRAFQWLRDTFGPIIEFLQRVRRKILELYQKWLRPIFDTIDVIRRVLSVLSLFNVQWARELDAKLAQLEEKLLAPIRLVVTRINEALDFLNRVVTLDGLLQRYTLLASAARDIFRIDDIWRNAFSKPLTEEERLAAGLKVTKHEPTDTAARLTEYFTTGQAPASDAIDELAAGIRIALLSR